MAPYSDVLYIEISQRSTAQRGETADSARVTIALSNAPRIGQKSVPTQPQDCEDDLTLVFEFNCEDMPRLRAALTSRELVRR